MKRAETSSGYKNILFFGGYILAGLIFAFTSYSFNQLHKEEKIGIYLQEQVDGTKTLFASAVATFELMAELTYREAIRDPALVARLREAARGDEQVRNVVREEIFQRLHHVYEGLREFGLLQLQFHLPGAISFLRFNQPQAHGDSLSEVRQDLVTVNETGERISGFQVGRTTACFRTIFPLKDHEGLVATVELAFSVQAMTNFIESVSQSATLFLFYRPLLDTGMWASNMERQFVTSKISPRYVVLRRKGFKTTEGGDISPRRVDQFLELLAEDDRVREAISAKGSFARFFSCDGQGYLAIFLNIRDVRKRHAGYLVFFKRDSFERSMARSFWQRTISGWMAIGLMLCLLCYYHRQQIIAGRKLAYLASTDLLTGIYNRTRLLMTMEHMMKMARRSGSQISLIFFDVDHFKEINDRYGHTVGDQILRELASLVSGRIRQSDIFGRWGGEEFIVVFIDCGLDEAARKAEEIRRAIANHAFSGGLQVTCSFGVATLRPGEDMESLIARADKALYKAKQAGRNRVELAD